jgi:hypothetical protein
MPLGEFSGGERSLIGQWLVVSGWWPVVPPSRFGKNQSKSLPAIGLWNLFVFNILRGTKQVVELKGLSSTRKSNVWYILRARYSKQRFYDVWGEGGRTLASRQFSVAGCQRWAKGNADPSARTEALGRDDKRRGIPPFAALKRCTYPNSATRRAASGAKAQLILGEYRTA